MNIREQLDLALSYGGGFAVCSPQVCDYALDYVRQVESQRVGAERLRATMEIEFHTKQVTPPLIVFTTKEAMIEHLEFLNTQ